MSDKQILDSLLTGKLSLTFRQKLNYFTPVYPFIIAILILIRWSENIIFTTFILIFLILAIGAFIYLDQILKFTIIISNKTRETIVESIIAIGLANKWELVFE